ASGSLDRSTDRIAANPAAPGVARPVQWHPAMTAPALALDMIPLAHEDVQGMPDPGPARIAPAPPGDEERGPWRPLGAGVRPSKALVRRAAAAALRTAGEVPPPLVSSVRERFRDLTPLLDAQFGARSPFCERPRAPLGPRLQEELLPYLL